MPDPTAPPSLTDLYIKARTQGLDDTNAALAVAQHLRQIADARSGMREAGAIAAGRPFDANADRAQLMGEADRPLQELAARRQVPEVAAGEVDRQMKVAGQDIALQQQRGLLDPGHPTNVATRAILAKAGIDVPPNTIAPALPKDLWEQIKPLTELGGKQAEIAAQAPGRAAEASKATAEAGKTRALTGPEAAKTSAEAEKAAAEAAVERQKIGGQVAPGWVRTGNVANVGDKEVQDFRTQATGANESERITNELVGILGTRDFPTTPKKIARAAVLSGKLLAAGKNAMGIRGLPAQDVSYLQSMQGDLSAGNPKNWLNLNQNAVRLKELNRNVQAELAAQARTLGFAPAGSGAGPSAPAAAAMPAATMTGKSGKKFEWVDGKGWMPAATPATPPAIAAVGP